MRHVLLLLSTTKKPHPLAEMRWHAENCARKGSTTVATTRLLSGLNRESSVVAFYGSSDLNNALLGYGLFAGFGALDQPRGREMLAAIPLYADGNIPSTAKGAVALTRFTVPAADTSLNALRGVIAS